MKYRTHYFLTLTILMLAAAFLTAQVDPGAANLVHSYTFEDGTASDVVGDADGLLVGGAAIVDGAMVTTAQDQWMEMPADVIAMNTFDEVTIEAWYTPADGANTGFTMLAYFGDNLNDLGSNGYFITAARADEVSRTAISIGDVATPWASETGVNGPEHDDGVLHHMVSTINATHISLYIDGMLMGSAPLAPNNHIAGISQNLAYLAKGGYSNDPEWIGAIEEFNIYNRALSAGEVLFLWAANPANEIKPANPGVAHLTHSYTFEDGTAVDMAGDANGILVGGAAIVDGQMVTTAQDQWMEMPADVIAMNTFGEVTIEAWYTPAAGANTGFTMLAYFGDNLNDLGSNGYFMTTARADDVSRTAISIGDVATPWASETGVNGPEYDDGVLHHMVSTINATHISFYIDGMLMGSAPLAPNNHIAGISQNLAYLAKGGYSNDPEWIGAIEEFNIYNKALSVGEVLYLYNKQPQRVIPMDPGTDNLVHAYTFEYGAATDEVGDASGILVGGAAIVEGQMVTTAQDQWMEMPADVIAMNTFGEVTIEAWYTPAAGANTGFTMLAYFGDNLNDLGSNGYFMTTARADDVSRTAISIGDEATPWASETGVNGPEYDDGVLHHMVSTINATHISFYIDGMLMGSEPLAANNHIAGISQNLAYLAKGGYSNDPEWIGTIEEFRIYNKALSPGEVLFLSNRKPFKVVPRDPGTDNLVHSYTFEYGAATDEAGDANGLLVGGAAIVEGQMVTTAQDQWMEMPADVIAMNTFGEVTIEAWYTPAAGANTGFTMLAYFGDNLNDLGSNGYFMTTARADDVSRTAISIGDEATPWASETGVNGPEYDDGVLHHMVSTINATHISFYIDGILMGSAPLAPNNHIAGISQNLAYLAKGGYSNDPEWIGAIDEFNIYNRALSAGEVLFLWNEQKQVGVEQEDELAGLPREYALSQNYPNPFNPRTKIAFSLPERSKVRLVIYDILGKQVAVLVDDVKEAGYYRAEFDGSCVASGMYLYVLKAGDRVISRKMLLTK